MFPSARKTAGMCETVRQTGVEGTEESCCHLYGFVCLLARIPFPPSLALVPYLTLSVSLAFPVLVRQQAAAAQHSLVHYLLVGAAPYTSKRRTQKLSVPETCSFYLGSFTLRHFQMEYNSIGMVRHFANI